MSSIPIVKRAVVARMKADAGLAGAQVKWGHPFPAEPGQSLLFWGDALNGDPTNGESKYGSGQTSGPMGRGRREERYVLHGWMVVTMHNGEPQETVTERAYQYVDVVEASIRAWTPQSDDWPQIPAGGGGATGVHWVLVAGTELAEGTDNTSRRAAVHIELAVAARI
jgi:peptidoglycan/xylan/chitin deacetylase (PgdA/CDA1 family)